MVITKQYILFLVQITPNFSNSYNYTATAHLSSVTCWEDVRQNLVRRWAGMISSKLSRIHLYVSWQSIKDITTYLSCACWENGRLWSSVMLGKFPINMWGNYFGNLGNDPKTCKFKYFHKSLFFYSQLSTKSADGNDCLVAIGQRNWLQNNKC